MGFRGLNRSILIAKQAFSRSYTSASISAKPFKPSSFLNYRPLFALTDKIITHTSSTVRCYSSNPETPPAEDSDSKSTKSHSNESIGVDGCDFKHWLTMLDEPAEGLGRNEIIDSYIKILAQVVGGEEEARKKIYSVSTKHYFAFGALVSEELSNKLRDLPEVRWVLPDSYIDIKNKDYGGEPFINGKAVPYDPKYHEEFVRNVANAPRAKERSPGKPQPRQNYTPSQPQNNGGQNFQQHRKPTPYHNAPPPQTNMGGNSGGVNDKDSQ